MRLWQAMPTKFKKEEMTAASTWLKRQHTRGALIGAFCSGGFLLAQVGLLDKRQATTTWWLQDNLRHDFPEIELAADAVLTTDERIICSAGPMSWVDLLLRLIEMVEGLEVARICADYAVVDTVDRTQAIYVPMGYLQSRDPLLVRADVLSVAPGSDQ
jgi:transcriptional regulator GlxA family with amidase domain